MTAYYNEHDPFAAAWLRELIKAGHIAPGDVDERSIEDVIPADLRGYRQCHFFAGIGVWSYALRQAGWPDDRPVWTGSCPCQPFSTAGKRAGMADKRHLWPVLNNLIQQLAPPVFFSEQVSSKDGRAWLDLVQTELEASGYAVGAFDLCASGFGAPHGSQRLYLVATPPSIRRFKQWKAQVTSVQGQCPERKRQFTPSHDAWKLPWRPEGLCRPHYWSNPDWAECLDPSGACWKPIEPGTCPMVDGPAEIVGRLRGYGNALVAPVAQAFIEAFLETETE